MYSTGYKQRTRFYPGGPRTFSSWQLVQDPHLKSRDTPLASLKITSISAAIYQFTNNQRVGYSSLVGPTVPYPALLPDLNQLLMSCTSRGADLLGYRPLAPAGMQTSCIRWGAHKLLTFFTSWGADILHQLGCRPLEPAGVHTSF